MLKKILLFTFLACMSIASSCLAANWLRMGEAVAIDHISIQQAMKMKTPYYYDGESLVVNHNQQYVEATYYSPNDKGTMDGVIVHRKRFYLSSNPYECKSCDVFYGSYDQQSGRINYLYNFSNKPESFFFPGSHVMSRDFGEYYRGYLFYKEFAYHFNLPNQDGTPYITPKSLGLKWIKSTSEVGVFYYPDSVKAKDNTVTAKISVWIPSINRIEVINGKFDYDKQVFKPSSAKFYRINTGELVDSHKKGLIPGLVGEALRTFRFDDDDSVKIASDFFKTKLAK